MLEEVYGHVDAREESLEVGERHGPMRGHRPVVGESFEVVPRRVLVVLADAPVPRHHEIQTHVRAVEVTLHHPYPVAERAPGVEVTGDGEPDGTAGVRPDPRWTRPPERCTHVDDLEGQVPYVPVGLE